MPQDHDAGYRLLFSDPRLVRDLVCGFVDNPWVQQLDFDSLERVPGQYVSESMRKREGDVAAEAAGFSCCFAAADELCAD